MRTRVRTERIESTGTAGGSLRPADQTQKRVWAQSSANGGSAGNPSKGAHSVEIDALRILIRKVRKLLDFFCKFQRIARIANKGGLQQGHGNARNVESVGFCLLNACARRGGLQNVD